MQSIDLSFEIFQKEIILKAVEDYKTVVKCRTEMNSDTSVTVIFHTDDAAIIKEFSNYLIALSAVEV